MLPWLVIPQPNPPSARCYLSFLPRPYCHRPLFSCTYKLLFPQFPWNDNHTKYTGGWGSKSEAQAKLPVVPKQTCPETERTRGRSAQQTAEDRHVRPHPLAALPLEFPPPMYSIDAGMVDHPSGGEASGPRFLHRVLFRTDHKAIGLQYLWLALLSVFLGMI